jgi:hypothetical protein
VSGARRNGTVASSRFDPFGAIIGTSGAGTSGIERQMLKPSQLWISIDLKDQQQVTTWGRVGMTLQAERLHLVTVMPVFKQVR